MAELDGEAATAEPSGKVAEQADLSSVMEELDAAAAKGAEAARKIRSEKEKQQPERKPLEEEG